MPLENNMKKGISMLYYLPMVEPSGDTYEVYTSPMDSVSRVEEFIRNKYSLPKPNTIYRNGIGCPIIAATSKEEYLRDRLISVAKEKSHYWEMPTISSAFTIVPLLIGVTDIILPAIVVNNDEYGYNLHFYKKGDEVICFTQEEVYLVRFSETFDVVIRNPNNIYVFHCKEGNHV